MSCMQACGISLWGHYFTWYPHTTLEQTPFPAQSIAHPTYSKLVKAEGLPFISFCPSAPHSI